MKESERYESNAFVVDTIPGSYEDVISSENASKWQNAMDQEMAALSENQTWILEKLPSGRRAIGCKWVFTIKSVSKGDMERFKARLVAKGFAQREGIDYFETFAPVVRYESIRMLLAMAAKEDFEMLKFDVKTAFINGDLHEEIYMEQPPGFQCSEHPDTVCKLQRSLYGLKQASRCRSSKFVSFLKINLTFSTLRAINAFLLVL